MDETLGQFLRQFRVNANFSGSRAASEFGISKAYLSAIEHDKKIPTANILRKMRIFYDINEFKWVEILIHVEQRLNRKFWGEYERN